jgi:hypothetical protein
MLLATTSCSTTTTDMAELFHHRVAKIDRIVPKDGKDLQKFFATMSQRVKSIYLK